ncbi:MAG: hypothetical protein H0U74_13735 [Bradymonadaceae bacterium]|nr:hypothetical protein [Lujinxingiaceae bacterium]
MKRLIYIAIILFAAIALAACSDPEEPKNVTPGTNNTTNNSNNTNNTNNSNNHTDDVGVDDTGDDVDIDDAGDDDTGGDDTGGDDTGGGDTGADATEDTDPNTPAKAVKDMDAAEFAAACAEWNTAIDGFYAPSLTLGQGECKLWASLEGWFDEDAQVCVDAYDDCDPAEFAADWHWDCSDAYFQEDCDATAAQVAACEAAYFAALDVSYSGLIGQSCTYLVTDVGFEAEVAPRLDYYPFDDLLECQTLDALCPNI